MILTDPRFFFFFFFQVLFTTTSFSSVLSCEDLLISQSIMFPRHLSFAETFYTKSWRFYQVLILMHQIKCQDLSLFGLRS